MSRWRKILEFYGSLILGLPRHLWVAADVASRLALLIVVVLALFFGLSGDIPIALVIALGVAVVFIALSAANYDRFAVMESSLNGVKADLSRVANQYAESTHRLAAGDQLLHVQINGTRLVSDLFESIKSGEGSRTEFRARVDVWESAADSSIAEWCSPSELEFYRRPLAPVALTDDWRRDLFEQVNVRVARVGSITTRTQDATQKWLDSV